MALSKEVRRTDLAQCIVDGVVRGVGDRPLEKLAQERDEVQT
jgi:hypothetical protein